MSDLNLLTELEFKTEVVKWLLKYDRIFFKKEGYDLEDYVFEYRLPEFKYVHLDSFIDDNDDVLTYLKSEIVLDNIQSRSCREQKLVFYHVLRTFIDSPEVEPYPMGYYIAGYVQGF